MSEPRITEEIRQLLIAAYEDGAKARDKHWVAEAQQHFEGVRSWEEMTGGFTDVATFVLHEVWKRDPRVDKAREEGRQEEREAIVEWLRKDSANEGIMDFVATQIHDGDHRIRP